MYEHTKTPRKYDPCKVCLAVEEALYQRTLRPRKLTVEKIAIKHGIPANLIRKYLGDEILLHTLREDAQNQHRKQTKLELPGMDIIEVKIRSANSTYYARAVGQNLQVSCTAGEQQAADALKQKHFPRAVLKKLQPNTEQNRNRLSKNITHLIITNG